MPLIDSNFSKLSKEELLVLCSKSINTMDGTWFTSVEDKCGFDIAMEIDMEVWRRYSLSHAWRLFKILEIDKADPITAIVQLVRSDPLKFTWKSEIMAQSHDKAIIRRMVCPPQEGRLKAGKKLFPGYRICQTMYDSFAETIDPNINVSCLSNPPCTFRQSYWCEWQFEIQSG